MTAFGTIARVTHVVLLALWFGGGVFFAALVAPELFAQMPSRQAAGDLVTSVLANADLFGIIVGPVLLITLFIGFAPLGVRLRLRALATVIMTVLTAVSGRWLSPKMVELRQAMGRPIEDLAATDPLKVQFSNLHLASEAMMTVHLLLALFLLVAAVTSSAPKRSFGIEL